MKRGEIFGLLGPNGAGKTTFINILSGTVIKSKGSVNVWGFDLDQNPRQVRASIGIVPQEVNLDAFFSPKKLLELQAGLYGVSKKEYITDTILKMVSLEKQAKSYSRNLSGGMKQRIMIGIALACNPNILIADEPTTALDVTIQKQILLIIKSLKDNFGMSIIFITHDMGVVAEIADKVIVMLEGEIVEHGDVNNIFFEPKHNYTKMLIDSVPQIGSMKGKAQPEKFYIASKLDKKKNDLKDNHLKINLIALG